MTRHLSSALPLIAAIALSGCPSSTTPGNVPIESLGATYGAATCDILRDCYGEAVLRVFSGSSSQAACVARAEANYTNGALPRFEAAIAMGTLTYDGSQAGACVDALRAEGCAALASRTPPACDGLFVGTVPPGGACAIDDECTGDSFCSVTAACPGTCQARGASGAACARDEACVSGLRCGAGNCQAPGGDGASCQGSTGVECTGGFICVGASGTTAGTCRATSTVFSATSGQACNVQASQFCQTGLSCIVAGITSMTCGASGIANGAACQLSFPDMCQPGSFCNGPNLMMARFDGTCAPLPTAGMACATVVAGQTCADGAVCVSGTCVEIQENGGACSDDAGCYGGHCVSGTCTAPPYCP